MTEKEIAMQLTLKAMECGYIVKSVLGKHASEQDEMNASEISKFFNTIYTEIHDSEYDFNVQS